MAGFKLVACLLRDGSQKHLPTLRTKVFAASYHALQKKGLQYEGIRGSGWTASSYAPITKIIALSSLEHVVPSSIREVIDNYRLKFLYRFCSFLNILNFTNP